MKNQKSGVDRVTLGNTTIIFVAQAREKAKKILGQVSLGINPKKDSPKSDVPTLNQFIEREYIPWSQAHRQWPAEHIQRLYRMKEFLSLPLARCFG